MTTVQRARIVNGGGGGTNLGHNPEVQNVDLGDHEGILARLETLMVPKNFPEFLHDNKRLFKFKSIVKLAKSNLNSVREKRSEGKSVLDHFSDGSIWFVGAIHSVPSDKTAECSQLISQFFTNGHSLRPRQNDEAVERLLGICGYINFLEANDNQDVFKFLWSLYSIRAMTAPGANAAIPSTTVAISPQKMQEILKQQEDGVAEQEQQLPNFVYDDVAIKIERPKGNELKLLNHDASKGTLKVKFPIVEDITDTVEYTVAEWDHKWVTRAVEKPKVVEEIVDRILTDENGRKIRRKTADFGLTAGQRDTYVWKKTGKKIQKTVRRKVAVEKKTTHSRNVNDKWIKTGNMLKESYNYKQQEWKSRTDTKLLYNKHTMNTHTSPIQPEITNIIKLYDGDGNACGMEETVTKFDTEDKLEKIDSYNLTAVSKQEETYYRVDKPLSNFVEYAETKQDHEAIVWEDVEYVIEEQDCIIELDDWQLVLEKEDHEEEPFVKEGTLEDITYPSVRIDAKGKETFNLEEQVWFCTEIPKSVVINTKAERMEEREYKISELIVLNVVKNKL